MRSNSDASGFADHWDDHLGKDSQSYAAWIRNCAKYQKFSVQMAVSNDITAPDAAPSPKTTTTDFEEPLSINSTDERKIKTANLNEPAVNPFFDLLKRRSIPSGLKKQEKGVIKGKDGWLSCLSAKP